jgi:serine phosphatase RsbU (regulator of sigma subunit)
VHIVLDPGDTLLFYTDGFLEARAAHRPDGMYGVERICQVVAGFTPDRALGECTDAAKLAIDRFTGSKELQDDLTLLVLRRRRV